MSQFRFSLTLITITLLLVFSPTVFGAYIINGGSTNEPPSLTHNNGFIESWSGSYSCASGTYSPVHGQFIDAFYGNENLSNSIGVINPLQVLNYGDNGPNGPDVCVSSPKYQCGHTSGNSYLTYICGPKAYSSVLDRYLIYIVGGSACGTPYLNSKIVISSPDSSTKSYCTASSICTLDQSVFYGSGTASNGAQIVYLSLPTLKNKMRILNGFEVTAYPCTTSGSGATPQCLNLDTIYDKLHFGFKKVDFTPQGSVGLTCFYACAANGTAINTISSGFSTDDPDTTLYPINVTKYKVSCHYTRGTQYTDTVFASAPFWANIETTSNSYYCTHVSGYVYGLFKQITTPIFDQYYRGLHYNNCSVSMRLVSVSGRAANFYKTVNCTSPLASYSKVSQNVTAVEPAGTVDINGKTYIVVGKNRNIHISSAAYLNSSNYTDTLVSVDVHLYNESSGSDISSSVCPSVGYTCNAECGCDHSYSATCSLPAGPGRYEVVVTSKDVYGNTNTTTKYFIINAPHVDIQYPIQNSNISTCQGLVKWTAWENYGNITNETLSVVNVNNPSEQWSETFTGINQEYHQGSAVFHIPGCGTGTDTYNVSVTAYDAGGYSATRWILINKTSLPVAELTFSSEQLDEGWNITFNGSASYDPDSLLTDKSSDIRAYYWVYQYPHDGSKVWRYGSGKVLNVLYPDIGGQYTVYLFVVDNEGQIGYSSATLDIGTTTSMKPKLVYGTISKTPVLMIYNPSGVDCGCWPGGDACTGTPSGSCPSDCDPAYCTSSNSSGGSGGTTSGNSTITLNIPLNVSLIFPENHTHLGSSYAIIWKYQDTPFVSGNEIVAHPALYIGGSSVYIKESTNTYSPPSYEDLVNIGTTSSPLYKFRYFERRTYTYPSGYHSYSPVSVNVSTSSRAGYSKLDLYFDTIAPKVEIISPENGANITSTSATIEWNATDQGYGIAYTLVTVKNSDGTILWKGVLPAGVNNTTVPVDPNYKKTTITTQVCDLSGNCGSDSITVRYTTPPVAIANLIVCPEQHKDNFVYSNYYDVVFNGTLSYDPDGGSIVDYRWNYEIPNADDCGNISIGSAEGAIADRYYPINCSGTYPIWLTVTDDEGQSSTVESYVVINCANNTSCVDLAVSNDSVSGSSLVTPGENQTLYVRIYNLGKQNLTQSTTVKIYDNGNPIDVETIPELKSGGVYTFNYSWKPSSGEHTVEVVVDPDNLISECNESNNKAVFTFNVGGLVPRIISPVDNAYVPNGFGLSWEVSYSEVVPSYLTINVYNTTGSGSVSEQLYSKIVSLNVSGVNGSVSGQTIISLPKGVGRILVNLTVNTTSGHQVSVYKYYNYDGIPPTINVIYPVQNQNVTLSTIGVEWQVTDKGSGVSSMQILSRSLRTGGVLSNLIVDPMSNHTVVKIDANTTYWPKTEIDLVATDLAGNSQRVSRVVRYTSLPVAIITICSGSSNCYQYSGPIPKPGGGGSGPKPPVNPNPPTTVPVAYADKSTHIISLPVLLSGLGSSSSITPTIPFTFDGLKSYDPDGGSIVGYSWLYETPTSNGGRKNETSTSSTVDQEYSDVPGLYGIWLNVTDDEGQLGSATATAKVCYSSAQCANPDPAIIGTDIHLKWSSLKDGDTENATITIHNLGQPLNKNLTVDIYDTGKLIKHLQISPSQLTACSATTGDYNININWTVDYIGNPKHVLEVKLDPNNAIAECNESNNDAKAVFYVYPTTRSQIKATCEYDSKCAIATKDCPQYWAQVCSGPLKSIIPCCSSDPTGAQCAKTCVMSTDVTAWIRNPEYQISMGNIETYRDYVDIGSFSGLSPSTWTSTESKKWSYQGSFSASKPGVYTLYLYGASVDGSTTSSMTRVLVSQTGKDFEWPDIAVENIETIPEPATGLPSDVYIVLKNKGRVKAEKVSLTGFIAPKSKTSMLWDAMSEYSRSLSSSSSGSNTESTTTALTALKTNVEKKFSESGSTNGLFTFKVETISLAPGEEKRVRLVPDGNKRWTPTRTGQYTIEVVALPVGTGDVNYEDNMENKTVVVQFGRKVSQGAAIPEYPGYTVIIAMLVIATMAYLISRRE